MENKLAYFALCLRKNPSVITPPTTRRVTITMRTMYPGSIPSLEGTTVEVGIVSPIVVLSVVV